jgi:hypothetical protein
VARTISTKWIYSQKFDLAFIIGPAVLVTGLVLVFGQKMLALQDFPLWLWVLLVLGIDVAHVYSSLFRTYFDPEEFAKRRKLYIWVPVICWGLGFGLYLVGSQVFWFVLAYAAIWHFLRQQYGFMMLYRRCEDGPAWHKWIDQAAIYLATVYPLVYWHTKGRAFSWFDEAQLLSLPFPWLEWVCRALYISVLLAYVVKEIKNRNFNLGKHLLLASTCASWFTGIVLFNGDLTFSLINIVSHGVPYLALVWIYQYRKRAKSADRPFLKFFQLKFVPIYLGVLFLLAFAEEWVWDNMVWREHAAIFGANLYSYAPAPILLAILVPLLAMPQATHYVLDAYIWRVNRDGGQEVRQVIG